MQTRNLAPNRPPLAAAPGTGLVFGAAGLLAAARDERDCADVSRRPGGPARHAWSHAPRRTARPGGAHALPLPERSHSGVAAKFGLRAGRAKFSCLGWFSWVFPLASRIITEGNGPALRVIIHVIDSKGLRFPKMLCRKSFFAFSCCAAGCHARLKKVVACPRLPPTSLSPTSRLVRLVRNPADGKTRHAPVWTRGIWQRHRIVAAGSGGQNVLSP